MRTGALGLAILSAVHACALPACGAGSLALVVGAALLVLPAAVLGVHFGLGCGVSGLGDAGVCTPKIPLNFYIFKLTCYGEKQYSAGRNMQELEQETTESTHTGEKHQPTNMLST